MVDDDPKLNKTVCVYLNDCGFETTGVLNAQAAYEALNSRPYDLIVSDIMMPGVDGFAFARSVPHPVHVGQGRPALQAKGLSAGD